jgi:hypothetical protein
MLTMSKEQILLEKGFSFFISLRGKKLNKSYRAELGKNQVKVTELTFQRFFVLKDMGLLKNT